MVEGYGRPDWDSWFMSLCSVVASRSHDPSTKHGAILSNSRHQILGVGYNGFPRGGRDTALPRTRPLKYEYIVHAEANCLLNSQNLMMSDDYTMYVTGMPCSRCLLLMIQSNVKYVVYGSVSSKCVDSNITKHLAEEYGIGMREFRFQMGSYE